MTERHAGDEEIRAFPEFYPEEDGSMRFTLGSSWEEIENLFTEFLPDADQRKRMYGHLLKQLVDNGSVKGKKVRFMPAPEKVIDLSDEAIVQLMEREGE